MHNNDDDEDAHESWAPTRIHNVNNENRCLSVSLGAFYQDGFGTSVAWFKVPNELPGAKSLGLGFDLVSKNHPAFVLGPEDSTRF